jgi:pilus assembly protein CpaE
VGSELREAALTPTPDTKQRVRLYATGSCEGFEKLRDSLASHPEIELVGSSTDVASGASVLAGGHLDAVLHATRSATLPADELEAIRSHARCPILLVASSGSSALLQQALDADVSDVLLLPQLVENVVFAIRKATHSGRRHSESGSGGRHGKIVTVFSPKGGTGKTVTATNLATTCAKFEQRKTLLLDLDLQFGDAAIMMGVEPEKTIYDLVVAPGELDSEKLMGYTTKHACGLSVLPAPLRPEDAELVTEAKLGRLLEVARDSFDVIVVDTSPFFHGPMLATLDRTDELLLLSSLDVPTLKNLRLALQTLDLLSFPKQRVSIVLNRSNSKVGMKPNEVEGALGMKVRFEVPSDRAVPLAVNRGNPVVLAEESADVSRAMKAMAKELFRAPKEETGKKRKLIPALSRA